MKRCIRGCNEVRRIRKYLLEHRQTVQVGEVVVQAHYFVGLASQTVEDHGLAVHRWVNEGLG